MFNKVTTTLAALGAAAALAITAPAFGAGTYQVNNHPDGGGISVDTDSDGYILRLNTGGVDNSFNANVAGTGVFLTINPGAAGTGTATLSGVVSHNESGTDSTQSDMDDDFYQIDATFATPLAGGDSIWYSQNADDVYSTILDDLLAAAIDPGDNAMFNPDNERLNFLLVDLSLTAISNPLTTAMNTGAFGTDLVWDEFPNDQSKPLFIQYGYRNFENGLSGAGWLNIPGADTQTATPQDLLFVLTPTVVPAPAALPAGIALLGMIAAKRRRKSA